jgi:[amino group carrier protein]-lysine/ornithine hydrolase
VGVDETAEITLLRRMVEIPSVTGDEAELAGFLAATMSANGFRARVDEVGNVVGEIGDPAGPLIMLLGHIDTVAGTPPVRMDGERLYGRGAVDAKGPFATMICAAARAAGVAGARLVLVGAVDEEGGSRGAVHLLDRYEPDAVVIGEPSGVDCVVLGYKGVFRFDYEVTRPLTHSSSAEEKATEVAAAFWQELRARLADRYPDGPLFDRAIPTLIAFEGDLERARLCVSCRTPVDFDIVALRAELREMAGDAQITIIERTAAVRSPRTDPVARALAAAIRRRGATPVTKLKLGTSDMNVVSQRWTAPMATYGPGDSRLDHTPDEHIDLRDYRTAIGVLAEALPEIAQMARERVAIGRALAPIADKEKSHG